MQESVPLLSPLSILLLPYIRPLLDPDQFPSCHNFHQRSFSSLMSSSHISKSETAPLTRLSITLPYSHRFSLTLSAVNWTFLIYHFPFPQPEVITHSSPFCWPPTGIGWKHESFHFQHLNTAWPRASHSCRDLWGTVLLAQSILSSPDGYPGKHFGSKDISAA